eukprot:SAG11_NODE_225_length_12064_cov_7.850815_4_plen_72_part_00
MRLAAVGCVATQLLRGTQWHLQGFGNLNKLVLEYNEPFWPLNVEQFSVGRSGMYARGFLTFWVNMIPVSYC